MIDHDPLLLGSSDALERSTLAQRGHLPRALLPDRNA